MERAEVGFGDLNLPLIVCCVCIVDLASFVVVVAAAADVVTGRCLFYKPSCSLLLDLSEFGAGSG